MLTDLDEALERLQTTDFECGDGSVNQGAATVMALESLGHPSLIPAFSDVYRPRLRPLASGSLIAEGARVRALGKRARRADWLATWEGELVEEGRDAMLARRLPGLLPGAFAAAGAGLVRTAMACLALARADHPARRRELAFGLALWASRYQVLPGQPGLRPVSGRSLASVLEQAGGGASRRRRIGAMSEAVLELEGDAAFASMLSSADLEAEPPGHAVLSLVRCTARHALAHPGARAVYGHAIKASMALHALMDVLPEADRARAAGCALQITLALHAVYAVDDPDEVRDDPERDALARDPDEIRYRAACSGDVNAITVAEACLRAHAAGVADVEDDCLLRAAADAALRFETTHAGRGG